nr:FAD-dependent tricarballylate dehydrogenase TcuA [Propylenella binzhouense]
MAIITTSRLPSPGSGADTETIERALPAACRAAPAEGRDRDPGSRGAKSVRIKEHCDVVVVGGGSAALETAVAARQAGAERVVMVEKAPESESGGNARFSSTGFRFVYSGPDEIRDLVGDMDDETYARIVVPPYTVDDFMADLNRVTEGLIDQNLAMAIAGDSNEAIHWTRELGIRWKLHMNVVVDNKIHFEPGVVIHPVGGGLGQLKIWREIATGMGVEIRYDSPVSALLGDRHRVEGVSVSTADQIYDLYADAVILCAGGFQANQEMRARYLAGNPDMMKVRGTRHDTGEVLRMALDLGARSAGHWKGAHLAPLDGASPRFEVPVGKDGMGSWTKRYSYPLGITVNKFGQRFYDEGEAHFSYTYAKSGRFILEQAGGVAYQIFDGTTIPHIYRHDSEHLELKFEADTLRELARKIGVNADVLEATVAEFNQAVSDDRPFDPTKRDGRHTVGIDPPKTNWASRIEKPPFRAYPVTGGIAFTFGGLEITADGQVVAITGHPIPGLYAVGDITGIFFHNYPSCSGQTRNAVFARRTTRHAVASRSNEARVA